MPALHTVVHLLRSVSKQKTLLRDLWCFHIQSFLRDRTREVLPHDFSVAHFAVAEDSLTDVLSEAFVLAVSSDAAVSSSIIADMVAFLPKDAFFLSLVKFFFSSTEHVHLPSISATRHIISALLLHDSDFAAAVCSSLSGHISLHSLLPLRAGRRHCLIWPRPSIACIQLQSFRRLCAHHRARSHLFACGRCRHYGRT